MPSRIPGSSELVERLLGVLAGGLGVTLRPYDLRHSGVTLNLNAGVPAPEVARRAGHGVAVLLRVYAGCIDGHEQLWNSRIDTALLDADEG
jgi:integrase